jgi:hypothetical protein
MAQPPETGASAFEPWQIGIGDAIYGHIARVSFLRHTAMTSRNLHVQRMIVRRAVCIYQLIIETPDWCASSRVAPSGNS